MKNTFNIIQLEKISHCAAILRACPAIPFALANKINTCKTKADAAMIEYSKDRELAEERRQAAGADQKQLAEMQSEIEKLNWKLYEVEYPDIKESEFEGCEIAGEKEVPQANGKVLKWFYRDAYFNLVGEVIH